MLTVLTCPDPRKPDNGWFYCHPSADFVLGGWCRFGCYEGYILQGSSVRTCLDTEQWDGNAPRCVGKLAYLVYTREYICYRTCMYHKKPW